MDSRYNNAKEILKKFKQEHLLRFYEDLEENKKQELLKQIENINFEEIENLYSQTKKNIESKNIEKIEVLPHVEKEKLSEEEKKHYKEIGIKYIKNGKLAAITMAGGQGTRLGHTGPKGTYILNVKDRPRSLFEILCDTLKDIKSKYGIYITWYIMTSKENHSETIKFFENNNYFNYSKEHIVFFMQGELPMVDQQGKILLEKDGLIKEASDGHGGIFKAMFKEKIVEDMKKRGIEWAFFGAVDNPLVKMVDEIFLGLAIEKNVLAASKSLVKTNAHEKVGTFCKKNRRPCVIEYTEVPEEIANLRDKNGNFVYGESHINCNMFNIKAIEIIGENKLPYHPAFKKASFLDENGNLVEPEEPNAYKFESFIFDAFQKLENMLVFRVIREEEFAPVKGKTGVDSSETAIELYNNYWKLN